MIIFFIEELYFLITIPVLLLFLTFFKLENKLPRGLLLSKYFYLFYEIVGNLMAIALGYSLLQFIYFLYLDVSDFSIPVYYQSYLQKDAFSVFFNFILNFLVFSYLMLSESSFGKPRARGSIFFEFPVILYIILGSLKLFIFSCDLIILLLSLEIVTFGTLLLMLGYQPNGFSLEAAIKYFIFNALGISFLLLAFNGYYLLTKSFNLTEIAFLQCLFPSYFYLHYETLFLYHFVFFFAYSIKLGLVPFHFWVPDVYEGVSLLITAFLVIILAPTLYFKFFQLTKQLLPFFQKNYFFLFFSTLGLLSLIIGTFAAFNQVRLKRFLAYIGLTHFGYLFLSFGTGTFQGLFASFLYLLIYIIMNLSFFSLLILVQNHTKTRLSFLFLSHFKYIFHRHFFFFISFTIILLSFAGFPPFAGFFSKFLVIFSLLSEKQFFLSFLLIFYILINAYLYLRFLKIALFEPQIAVISFFSPNFRDKKIYQLTEQEESLFVLENPTFNSQSYRWLLGLIIFLLFFLSFFVFNFSVVLTLLQLLTFELLIQY